MEREQKETLPGHPMNGGDEVAAPTIPQDLAKVAAPTEREPDPRAPGPVSGHPLGRFLKVPEGCFLVHDPFGIGGASAVPIADYPRLHVRQK